MLKLFPSLEGDSNSHFVKAEFAQIQATITLEQENEKITWRQYFTTAGNQRRALIALCIGFFAQASGSNPIYFYLVKILAQVGITDASEQNAFNMGMYCWALVNAVVFSLVVNRFRRRDLFLTSVIGMLAVYIVLTVSAARYAESEAKVAGVITLLAIMLYSPFYNMGFVVLPYSMSPFIIQHNGNHDTNALESISCGSFPLHGPCEGNSHGAVVGPFIQLYQYVCQPDRDGRSQMEVLHFLLRLDIIRGIVHLPVIPRD